MKVKKYQVIYQSLMQCFAWAGPMDTFMEEEYPWLIEEKKKN